MRDTRHGKPRSAREALQLGVWLDEPKSGFQGLVTQRGPALKLPIRDTRIYAVCVTSPKQQKPNDWLYTNVGLVLVDGTFPKTVEPAGADDWAQLTPGIPLHALCYAHEGDLMTPEDRIASGSTPSKILFVNAHPQLPSKLRVHGVKVDLPKFPQGSPFINSQGKVVAVYLGTGVEQEGSSQHSPGIENMLFATVIQSGI